MPQFRVVEGPGVALVATGLSAALVPDAWLLEPVADGLIAFATGGQAKATPLTGEFSRVATVATAGDSVLLPSAIVGLDLLVLNDASNPMSVFPSGSDTIDAAAASASVSQMQKSFVFYVCVTAGQWRSIDLSTGFDPVLGLQTMASVTGITAKASGTQTNATQLTSLINRVTTVATAGDAVALPQAVVGLVITVINKGANPMQVFGNNATGDTINGIATATGISQGINTNATYICTVAGNWEVPLTALWSSTPQAIGTATFAIPPHASHTYVFNRSTAVAATLAAPTAGTDDGIELQFTSDTAQQHAITATNLLDTGASAQSVATWPSNKGASLNLMAFNGRWKVLSSNQISFT